MSRMCYCSNDALIKFCYCDELKEELRTEHEYYHMSNCRRCESHGTIEGCVRFEVHPLLKRMENEEAPFSEL